ncbi:MAG: DUF305 domain-containing protein [Anaerolineales bacterium]|nr:DUF305 domain-containing protein [Anaerolineales bacterium]
MNTASETQTQTLPRWFWPLLVALMLIVVAGLGWLWWSVRPPAEGDPAVTFARDMSAHHKQAVEMALIIRDRTEDAELRQLLIDMILTQQGQIGQMQGWLQAWGLPAAGLQPPMTGQMVHNGQMMTMTPEMMGMQPQVKVNELRTLELAQAEIQFLRMMIDHHRGGVLMAESVLAQTQRPEVRRLAESIITAQTGEIRYMQELLRRRGVTP